MYTAYVLTDKSRAELLQKFPPVYSDVRAHHVTLDFGVPKGTAIPPEATIKVVGYSNSGDGLEVLVVTVDGEMVRPDGGLYHITWSIDPTSNYKAKDSVQVLRSNGYTMTLYKTVETIPSVLSH